METIVDDKSTNLPSVGLLRLLAALFYDSLLLLSVLFIATWLLLFLIPEAVSHLLIYRTYLLVIWFLYFAWPWLHGGQTLGMAAWGIQLQSYDGRLITWQQALVRFSMAIVSLFALGMGYWWMLVDKQRRTWHDSISKTRLVYLSQSY